MIKTALLVLTCGLLLAATAPDGDPIADFDIPAGMAAATLQAWSQTSGLVIQAPPALSGEVTTNAVKGPMDIRTALDEMIAGTKLQIVADDGSRIRLAAVAPSTALAPLPPPAPKPRTPAPPASRLSGLNLQTATIDQLIDALAQVGRPGSGLSSTASFQGFIAEDETFDFVYGILGSPAPVVDPVMRELARRGPAALPALLRHLGDARPTSLSVGGTDIFFYQSFMSEYDSRSSGQSCMLSEKGCFSREFSGPYVLRIGDLCFTLVGQIVGRRLEAVRYQPTGNLFVNSPVQNPVLAAWTRRDWAGVGAAGMRASLIRELDDTSRWRLAMPRLRLYFPDAYANLTGLNLRKRQAYELEVEEARRQETGNRGLR